MRATAGDLSYTTDKFPAGLCNSRQNLMRINRAILPTSDDPPEGNQVLSGLPNWLVLDGDHHIYLVPCLPVQTFDQSDLTSVRVHTKVVAADGVEEPGAFGVSTGQGVDQSADRCVLIHL